MERHDVVAVDQTVGGLAEDSLVTIAPDGAHIYHFPGDVVFTGKVFTPNGVFKTFDEAGSANYPGGGGFIDDGTVLMGPGTRMDCSAMPYRWMFGDLNSADGADGYKDSLEDIGCIYSNDEPCASPHQSWGHGMNYGTSAILLKGSLARIDAQGQMGNARIYGIHGNDTISNPEQDDDDFLWYGNASPMGIVEDAAKPLDGTDKYRTMHRLCWTEVNDDTGFPNIGQAIWLKGDVWIDGAANGGSSPELWGQSIVLSGSSQVASIGLYIDSKNGSIQDDGTGASVDCDDRSKGIVVKHGVVEVYDPIRSMSTTSSKYLELDWHNAAEDYGNLLVCAANANSEFGGCDATTGWTDDDYAIINVNNQANAGETNDSATAKNLHFNFNNDNQAILFKEGDLSLAGDLDSYRASDERLKEEIHPIEDALTKIKALNGVSFEWNMEEQSFHKGSDIGVIAQDVEKVVPEAVSMRKNGFMGVKYELLVPVLIEAVKELSGTVTKLEEKLEKLESSDENRTESF